MPEIEIPFATQAGESSVIQNSAERLVNMYAELEVSGRKRIIRRQRAGLRQLLANTGTKRAIEHYNGTDYTVIGNTFYSFNGTSLTSLGTLSSSSGRCWIIFNDLGHAMVSDGSVAYNYNGSTFTAITTPGSVAVGTLAYQSGYGIFNVPNEAQFYITALNDFSTIDALDFATAESSPDPILRVFVDHGQLFLCGTRTIEAWQQSGTSDFPYQPLTNSTVARGIAAKNAIVSEDNTIMFVGDDKVIYRLQGYTPTRVSNGAIERAILAVSQAALDGCEAFAYTSGGQKFITFRFDGELTVQYNLGTGLWNYAKSYGYADWRMLGSAGGYNRYFATPTGLVALDESLNTDETVTMLRVARSAPGDAGGKEISVISVFLDAEMGRAAISVDANVMLRFAPDGETFGNIRTRSLGSIGDYRHRAVWRAVGSGRKPTLEFSMSDNARFSIMAAICDLEAETD